MIPSFNNLNVTFFMISGAISYVMFIFSDDGNLLKKIL